MLLNIKIKAGNRAVFDLHHNKLFSNIFFVGFTEWKRVVGQCIVNALLNKHENLKEVENFIAIETHFLC